MHLLWQELRGPKFLSRPEPYVPGAPEGWGGGYVEGLWLYGVLARRLLILLIYFRPQNSLVHLLGALGLGLW